MRTVRDPTALEQLVRGYRSDGQVIGFVPTMGALHDGHLSLAKLARERSDRVVISIFVNPTQFAPNEDYERYPRDEARDLQLLDQGGADVVYLPGVAAMYSRDASIVVDPGPMGRVFEGEVRPGHFRGVLTVVAKLFHQVNPHVAVFGQKDAQQLFLIRRMVSDLNFAVTIVEGDTVREPDGLAMSSRNVYLKVAEREKATVLFQALQQGRSAIDKGVRSVPQIQRAMRDHVALHGDVTVDYLTAVSEDTFTECDPLPDVVRLIGAIRLGPVRLIDNLLVKTR